MRSGAHSPSRETAQADAEVRIDHGPVDAVRIPYNSMHQAAEFSSDLICFFDPEGRLLYLNSASRRLLGIGAKLEIGELEDKSILTPEFLGLVRETIIPTARDGGVWKGTVTLTHAWTKHGIVFDQTTFAFNWAGGVPAGYISVARDITAAEQTLDELYRSAETFRQLISGNPFGIYLVNADFRLIEISRGAQKVFANVIPLLGRDFAEILRTVWPEPFATEVIDHFRQTLETGQPYVSHDNTLVRRNVSDEEAYDWRIERIILPDARYGVVCFFYDLTERRRLEVSLGESEAQFRSLFDNATVGIARVGLNGAFIDVNDRFCEIVGFGRAELIETGFQNITHPDDLDADEALVAGLLAGASDTYKMEKRYIDKAGAIVWVDLSVRLVRAANGAPLHFVSVIQDISDRRSAIAAQQFVEQQLRLLNEQLEERVASRTAELRKVNEKLESEVNRREATQAALAVTQKFAALGQLVASVVHDFNNIVAAISSGFTLIEKRTDDSTILEITRHGINAAQRSEGVVKQLLAFARQDLASMHPVNLHELLHQATPLIQRSLGIYDRFSIDCPSDIGRVLIDPIMLETALINLAVNARDAMPDGGNLHLIARHCLPGDDGRPAELGDAAVVMIALSDTGSGMSPEIISQVTTPFFTTKRQGQGTGLGLAMVRSFVEQSNGTLCIKSEIGKGTTVTLYLPSEPDTGADRPSRATLADYVSTLHVDNRNPPDAPSDRPEGAAS
jgi:PAS domain S-box-containing protein